MVKKIKSSFPTGVQIYAPLVQRPALHVWASTASIGKVQIPGSEPASSQYKLPSFSHTIKEMRRLVLILRLLEIFCSGSKLAKAGFSLKTKTSFAWLKLCCFDRVFYLRRLRHRLASFLSFRQSSGLTPINRRKSSTLASLWTFKAFHKLLRIKVLL